jgi:erythronate-4-phosphate dehydrogenase
MLKILYDQSIPHIHQLFSNHFELCPYINEKDLLQKIKGHDILICRSSFPITGQTLKNSNIQLVATASSGSEHLQFQNSSIIKMDARGGNAHAVSDYITACLACLNVSNNQSLAIIGHGFVGQMLNKRLTKLGFSSIIYDPFQDFKTTWDEVVHTDIILVHPNYHQTKPYATHHLLSYRFFRMLSEQTMVINASRGKILDEQALIQSPWKGIFCTDVYQNEPHINPLILERASICTPHIAGHSIEAKFRITEILAQKIHQHYHLNIPREQNKNLLILDTHHWKQEVLKIYNPMQETKLLKVRHQIDDFINLRRTHHRHEYDFN